MINYVLANDTLPEPGLHKMENIRELTYEEMNHFSNAVKSLNTFNIAFSLFEICEKNFIEIEKYIKELNSYRGGNQQDFHKITINWNALTLNYLASYRLFNDHLETILDRNDDPEKSSYAKFKELTALHYDRHFFYRFLWHLRNYFQHCGLPACEWIFSENKESSEKGRTLVEITYLRDSLLEGFDWKKLRTELENQPLRIDVPSLIRELHSSIRDISRFVAIINIVKYQNQYSYLNDLLSEVILKVQTNPSPVVLKFEILEGSNPKFLGIVQFPLRIMTNIRNIEHELNY